MKYALGFLLLTLSADLCAQKDTVNAVQKDIVTTVQKDTVTTIPFSMRWTKPRFVPRLGIAVQETGSVELGVARQKIFIHPLSLASMASYVSAEAMIRDDNFVFGPKAGYEFTIGLIGVAADMTYYTDTHKNSLVFTPKGGLTIFGFVSLYYGRNITVSNDYFDYISKNRFSITFHINRDYFDLKEAPRKVLR
jgi:hypothetical protein